MSCRVPPTGWICTREPGHDGPCAAVAVATDQESSAIVFLGVVGILGLTIGSMVFKAVAFAVGGLLGLALLAGVAWALWVVAGYCKRSRP